MELLLIRHGQSGADVLGVHEGRADFALTELGENQATKMANYITVKNPPNVILSSPLIRAKQTATTLQEFIGCKMHVMEDLMEFNNGVLAGLPRKEAAIKYPFPEGGRPAHVPIQDGESELEFRFRAERVLSKIMYEYREYHCVAVVSHGGMISKLLQAFLKLPTINDFAFATGDTGIHLVEVKEDLRVIRFLNKQEHLNL